MLLGKTLYIHAANAKASGASVISDRNQEMINCNSSLVLSYEINITLKNVKQNIKSIIWDLNLVNQADITCILALIKSESIDTVFIDHSLLGNITKSIRLNFSDIYIISFFHNVEYQYFKELIRVSKKMRHYFTLALIKKAEKQIVKYSDVIITLNNRDSNDLQKLYERKADLILPTSFRDTYDVSKSRLFANKGDMLNLLFVGSYFPPNIYAVDWFVDRVLPYIERDVKLYIVGNGFESHKLKNVVDRIELIGRVEDLSEYYYLADLVVAPIFHGSGMKTKVAEALMFNKPVLGTEESFEGYDVNINEIGRKCDNPEEFIDFIESFNRNTFNTRDVFLSNYNFDQINAHFNHFLNTYEK